MNKGIGMAMLIAAAGLLCTLVGYLGGVLSADASAGTSLMPPSKTTRVVATPGETPKRHHDPSDVDLEFIDWMRTASGSGLFPSASGSIAPWGFGKTGVTGASAWEIPEWSRR